MSVGDVFGMAIAMIGLITLAGIMTETYKRRLTHRERMLELKVGQQACGAQPDRIEERLRVLERIATDNPGQLASAIEQLRQAERVA